MSEDADKFNPDELINELSQKLEPVKVMEHPIKRALPWVAFVLFYLSVALIFLGIRSDFLAVLGTPIYMLEMIIVFAMACFAALCSMWLCVPDMRGAKWMLSVPFTLCGAFFTWTALRVVDEGFYLPQFSFCLCTTEIIINAILPAAALFYFTVKGKTTRPYLMAFMNVMAVGGFGYVASRLTCGYDDIMHVLFSHVGPYILMGMVLGMVGKRIYRW